MSQRACDTVGQKGLQGGGFYTLERAQRVNVLTTEDMAVDGGVSRTQMDFWDGMESVFMMPSLTPTGTGRSAAGAALSGMRGQDSALTHVGLGTAVTHSPGVLEG